MTHEELDVITKSMIKRWLETYVVSDRDKWLAQRAGDTYSVQANQHTMEEVEDRLFAACSTRIAELRSQRDDLLAACEGLLSLEVEHAAALDICVDNWPLVKMARAAIAKAREAC